MAATLLALALWRFLKSSRTKTKPKMLERALWTARKGKNIEEISSEEPPGPPPPYSNVTSGRSEQHKMKNHPGGSDKFPRKNLPELSKQITRDNKASAEYIIEGPRVVAALTEQRTLESWRHQTEMPYLDTGGQSICSSGLAITPNPTGNQKSEAHTPDL